MSGRPGGKKGIRDAIKDAAPIQPAGAAAPPAGAPGWMLGPFEMLPDGLFRNAPKDESGGRLWLSGPFVVEAETRDDEGRGWGLLIAWKDRDGGRHEEAFPRSLFAGECAELRGRLADGGLPLNGMPAARQAFAIYLNLCQSTRRARSVQRVGWHTMASGRVFVLPDRVFGEAAERVVLQVPDREPSLFNAAGSLEDWRYEVSRVCAGNSRLLFAASCAFAAPLLGLLGEDGGGFNLRGGSRTGKSTALRVAASVCGGLPGQGAAGFTRQWRATGNGIEAVAGAHSDCLLPLDEMGQIDAREAGEVAYMLANGQGKARAGRTGAARQALRFRVLFLSTGEIGLADKNAEAGRATKAGQEVRLVDISSDAGAGHGLFEYLHGHPTADAFVRELRLGTASQYGTAFPAFLTWLIENLTKDRGFIESLRDRVTGLLQRWLIKLADAGGQVRSVGHRFALVAIAGELAREAGIVDWTVGAASNGVEACFRAWLSERGTVGAAEDAQAVRQLLAFVARHGAARFDVWSDAPPLAAAQHPDTPDDAPPSERFRTQNRAGWRRWISEDGGKPGWKYYLTAEGMKEALTGLAPKESKRTLIQLGFIVPPRATADIERNNTAGLHTVPGHGKLRLYELRSGILASDEGSG